MSKYHSQVRPNRKPTHSQWAHPAPNLTIAIGRNVNMSSSSYLSRHEIDDIRPELDRMVYKVLGNSDSAVRTVVEQCLHGGFDRKRTTEKLADVLDSRRAAKMYDRLEDLLSSYRSSSRSRKRGHTEEPSSTERRDRGGGEPKKPRAPEESNKPPLAATATAVRIAAAEQASVADSNGNGAAGNGASSGPLTTNQIQQMMQNAQREIEERKRALANRKAGELGSAGLLPLPQLAAPVALGQSALAAPAASSAGSTQTSDKPPPSAEDIERAKKIADLQAQIRARLSGINQAVGLGIGSAIGGVGVTGAAAAQEKPKPLILDEEGRTVDKTGRAISIPTLAPTLKANIRAKKKEIFNKASQPVDRPYEEEGQHFFDERIMAKPAVRNKRLLRFHEPGKFQQQAERMRMKAQLEKLQNEISQIARKTGISSATKLALIAPKQDSHADDVPQMEWWDSVILTDDLNTMDGDRLAIRESAITNLIEHPTQMKPPSE